MNKLEKEKKVVKSLHSQNVAHYLSYYAVSVISIRCYPRERKLL